MTRVTSANDHVLHGNAVRLGTCVGESHRGEGRAGSNDTEEEGAITSNAMVDFLIAFLF